MDPKISIVTPSFNQGPYIEQCIRSVLDQDYPDVEHIIFDGGSKDGTVEVLRRYENRGVRWTSEPDKGQSDAINKGFRAATGDIIGWLNSDDWYARGAFRVVLDYFRDHPEVDFVYGNNFFTDAQGRMIRLVHAMPYKWEWLLYTGLLIPQPGVFMRRRVLEECGLLDVDLHIVMDYEWWLRIAPKYPPHFINRYLAYFRLHPASKTCGEIPLEVKRSEHVGITRRYERQTPLRIGGRLGRYWASLSKRLAFLWRALMQPRGQWAYCTRRVVALVSDLDHWSVSVFNALHDLHDMEIQVWIPASAKGDSDNDLAASIRFPWRRLAPDAKQPAGPPQPQTSSLNGGLLRALRQERPSVVVVGDSSSQVAQAACYCTSVGADLICWNRSRPPTARDTNSVRWRWLCRILPIVTDSSASSQAAAGQLHRVIVRDAIAAETTQSKK
ncbi:MAG: glycosyltransferase family 2 protein [Verrucomicrobia bacterium]|nr:glycosyltransferase family 2 protein [Verrucomicrobiota bacterium]